MVLESICTQPAYVDQTVFDGVGTPKGFNSPMFSPHHYDYDHGENFPFNDREDYNDYGANPGYDEMIDNPFERDFDRNPTALLTMIQKKAWPEAIERTMGHFEEARVWVSRRESDGNLRWRLLPIHAAMVFKAPKNVVKNLLAAYPPGAAAQDDRGMLPLHLAFRTGAPESIVHLLLEAFPQAIDIQDLFFRYTMDSIGEIGFGVRMETMRGIPIGPGSAAANVPASHVFRSHVFAKNFDEAQRCMAYSAAFQLLF